MTGERLMQEQGLRPDAGDGVLLAAGFVPEAAEERDAAEEGGGEGDQRQQKEIGEPAEGLAWGGCVGEAAGATLQGSGWRSAVRIGRVESVVIRGHSASWRRSPTR